MLSLLRIEASDRFLRWREVERAVRSVHRAHSAVSEGRAVCDPESAQKVQVSKHSEKHTWNKAAWEAEWDATLSRDVARRLREATVSASRPPVVRGVCVPAPFDPLHLPSLFACSFSLLAPLKHRIVYAKLSGMRLGAMLFGALCAGIGIGLALRS